MNKAYKRLKALLEDYPDSLNARKLENNPERDGINLKKLAKKYNLFDKIGADRT